MRKFEIGKRYFDIGGAKGLVYEVIGRTEKTLKFVAIQHAGKFNERQCDVKSARIKIWDDKEVFITSSHTIGA